MKVYPCLQFFPACHCVTLCAVQPARRAIIALLFAAAAGCHSMPALQSPSGTPWQNSDALSAAAEPEVSLLSSVPEFDESFTPAAISQPAAAATAKVADFKTDPSTVDPVGKVAAPLPANGNSISGNLNTSAVASPPTSAADTAASMSTAGSKGADATVGTITSPSSGQQPASSKPVTEAPKTQVAENVSKSVIDQTPVAQPQPRSLPKFSERPPESFAWRRTGKSAGGRPFEFARTGTTGFRTLFVGSAVGNDPAAIQLMDKLARHLHDESLILGGFETAVIRTLNPDGAASRQSVNALGRYVNGRFPVKPSVAAQAPAPEVEFLLGTIRSFNPQRVVHVRTIAEQAGIIAANQPASDTAQSIAAALKFSRLTYPNQAREGSLEFCLSSDPKLEVITLAIPVAAKETDLWNAYGDTLLNLIQHESLRSREASREQQQQPAATR